MKDASIFSRAGNTAHESMEDDQSARPGGDSESIFHFGPFRFLAGQRVLLRADKPVRLGSRAREILVVLVERAGKIVKKSEIIARVWPDTIVEEGTLRVHIAALRKALGDGGIGVRYVENVTGHGYRFVAPLTRPGDARSQLIAPDRADRQILNLPASTTPLIGRSGVVSTLTSKLPLRRFMTIVGPGGIGKTAVAVSSAELMRGEYSDGVCFVDLGLISDPLVMRSTVACALGLVMIGQDPLPAIEEFVRHKRMLILLDNCEHVIEEAAVLVERLLVHAPNVHILATSREPLHAKGEWVLRLCPLEFPPPSPALTAAEALRFPAIQLFTERATASLDVFELADGDVPVIADICLKLDGLPLAIELAAARVDQFGIRGLAEHLDDRLGLLTNCRRTAASRHRTLRATLEWSFNLLPVPEQVVLRRLAVFVGDFDADSAGAVVNDRDASTAEMLEMLASLAAKSLLSIRVTKDRILYRLLETSRAYALEKLNGSEESADIKRRHAILCCSWGKEVPTYARSAGDHLEASRRRIDDVRAALRWCYSSDGDASIGAALAAASAPLWFQLCLLNEYREHLQRVLEGVNAPAPSDEVLELQLNAALGETLVYTRGACPAAAAAFGRALQIADRLDVNVYRKRALWGLWVERLMAADYGSAVRLAERFRLIADNPEDPWGALVSDRMMALAHHFCGNQAIARRHAESALMRTDKPRAVSDPTLQFVHGVVNHRVAAYAALAHVLWIQGFPEQAMQAGRDSVEWALSIDDALSLCYGLACVGGVALWRGDLSEARRLVAMLLDHSTRHSLELLALLGAVSRGRGGEAKRAPAGGVAPRFVVRSHVHAIAYGKPGDSAGRFGDP